MKIKAILSVFFLILYGNAMGDDPSWVWFKGSNLKGQLAVYGAQGVSAATNTPGARVGAVSWSNASGKIWIFGGSRKYLNYHFEHSEGLLNDLWRYDPATNCWTWMKGSNLPDHPGSYGVQGEENPSNNPRARAGAASWTDASGRLWLFGGAVGDTDQGSTYSSGDFLEDLWRYDPVSNNWTWIMGSNQINQVTPNTPGYCSGTATCAGRDGRFWLYGGDVGGLSNILWVFEPDSNHWTKVKGGGGSINELGVYGTRGEPDPANRAGARYNANLWCDKQGKIWLWGGFGYSSFGAAAILNDLWCFDPVSSNWTWVKGDDMGNAHGNYGTQDVEDPASTPGACDSAMGWTDGLGRFWLFGGLGDIGGGMPHSPTNELWLFNPDSGNWTWIQGRASSGSLANYGIQGVPAPTNVPGGRGGAVAVRDKKGVVWIFGGYGFDSSHNEGLLNDLWRLTLPNAVSFLDWNRYP